MEYRFLEWDSNFFGFKVALIENCKVEEIERLKAKLQSQHFKLAYLMLSPEHEMLNIQAVEHFGKPVDTRVTLKQNIVPSNFSNDEIEIYNAQTAEPELEQLSLRSGMYSRFALDPRIETQKFEALYLTWLMRSLKKEIAGEVLVYRELNKIKGFITASYDIEKKTAKIGLIAVAEGMEGRGIGKKLIQQVQTHAFLQSCTTLEVVTQKNNISALKLYEKTGFQVVSELNIYHLWLKKKKAGV